MKAVLQNIKFEYETWYESGYETYVKENLILST